MTEAINDVPLSPAFSTIIGRRGEVVSQASLHEVIDRTNRVQRRNAEVAALEPLMGFWSDEVILDMLRAIDKRWALPE